MATGTGTVLDKETTTITTDAGDHDRFAHYFKKSDIEATFMDGVEITALCGKKDRPTRDFMKYPVCGTCKDIMEGLPAA